jgi:hypothetical protein
MSQPSHPIAAGSPSCLPFGNGQLGACGLLGHLDGVHQVDEADTREARSFLAGQIVWSLTTTLAHSQSDNIYYVKSGSAFWRAGRL